MRLSRRNLLKTALAAGGTVTLGGLAHQERAHAQASDPRLLLMVYFAGGWDQLLAFDPRPHDDPQYQPGGSSGIVAGYDIFDNAYVNSVLSANPSGVRRVGNLSFGPAVPESLLAHAQDLSIVRGLMMDTLNHEAGRRYFLTGQFPTGVVAKGSSLTTHVAAQAGLSRTIPNLAISTEAYNRDQAAEASPTFVSRPRDLNTVLLPMGTEFPPAVSEAVRSHEQSEARCELDEYNGEGKVELMRSSRTKVFSMLEDDVASHFDIRVDSSDPAIQDLLEAFDIRSPADINSTKGRAALAGQALAQGVSQGVSLLGGGGLDTHDARATTTQPSVLVTGFDALGRLIAFLKNQPFGDTGESVWSFTTLVAFSEFARTPRYKVGGGRDHHLASSCLVAGPGIVGNRVVGATSDQQMAVMPVDVATGMPTNEGDPNGVVLRPADVHATLLSSMGLDDGHLDNLTPTRIDTLLA